MEYDKIERMASGQEVGSARSSAFPALMRKVYVWMTLALGITAFTAYLVASSPSLLSAIYGSKIALIGLIVVELGLVIGLSARIDKLSFPVAAIMFILYSVVNGATLSSIFVLYSPTAITKAFLVSAGMFAVMAVAGYTTRADLTKLGGYLTMALVGVVIAMLVNLFIGSSGFDLIISFVGVVVFIGLTAWDSQSIKRMLLEAEGEGEASKKVALMGSLSLYLDFINIFLYLLRFFGRGGD